MSGDLTIRWPGGEKTFSPGTTVRIGRDPGGEVVIDNANVSRLHAIVVHDGSSWVLRDQGSFQGTFRDGQAVTEVSLGPSQTVTLGAPQVGARVEMQVGAETAPTRPREVATDGVDTVVPNRDARPGGALRDDVFDSATVVGGQSLRVECGGKTYQFSPGKRVTVGRDASADVVSTNPTVSRNHAVISHDGQGWLIEDSGSAAGTFIDGRKIQTARLTGSTAVWLGDPDTGERVVIVASGEKESTPIDRVRRLSRSGWLGLAAAVFAVVAIGVAVFALNSRDTSQPLDRDQLARGVVRIETSEGSLGSGTVVDSGLGLILTSAHVVEPRSPGQGVARGPFVDLGENPRTITVSVSDGIDEIAEPRFRAEVVASDGYLDLAVLRITETIGGALIEEGDLDDLVAIPIGDAGSLESGDAIQILGHPTVAQSNAATLTTGVLAGAVQDIRLGSNRAYFNLDAQIRPGNSGGLVADSEGRIIGVPTLNWIEDSSNIGAMRPIDFAEGLLEKARANEPYESPYVTLLTGEEDFPGLRYGQSADIGFRTGCTTSIGQAEVGSTSLTLAIDYSGFTEGKHQDVAIVIHEESTGEDIGLITTTSDWPFEFEESGCFTVTIPLERAISAGNYFVDFFIGPNYEFDGDLSYGLEF